MAYGHRQVREARSRRAAIVALAATLVAGGSSRAVMGPGCGLGVRFRNRAPRPEA